MGKIKNWTFYFHNDQINLKDFDASLVKIDKKKTTKTLTFITLVMWLLKNLLIATILTV